MAEKPVKKIEKLTIVRKQLYDNRHIYFELQAEKPWPVVFPGQFVQVQISNNSQVFLRRPLSVHDWDNHAGILSLWIKVVGRGTGSLAEMQIGDSLDVIYPLGNGFSSPAENEGVLLVGGGCGAAPLLYLARFLNTQGVKIEILLGASNISEIIHPEKYKPFGNVHFMTEDGSAGGKGFVTHHPLLAESATSVRRIYACGPDPMMKAVAVIAHKHSIPCEISLENMMACGIGACLCCVVKTDNGHVCSCTEGPVFDTVELKEWIQS